MRLAFFFLLLAMQESWVEMSPRYDPQILVCLSCIAMFISVLVSVCPGSEGDHEETSLSL